MQNFINGGYCHRGKIFYVWGNFLRKRLYFCIRKGMRFWEKERDEWSELFFKEKGKKNATNGANFWKRTKNNN